MNFYLIGISYKTATIDAREELYRRRKDIFRFWENCEEIESALLFTCNRIEIYIVSENPDQAISRISEFKKNFQGFLGNDYFRHGRQDVFNHGLRLSLGLESQIKGEQEIFHQLKKWAAENSSKQYISSLWSEIFDFKQKSGVFLPLYADPINIADVVVYDLARRIGFKAPLDMMVVGTGKIAQLFSEVSMPEANINFYAHKNFSKAKIFAERSGGRAFFLKDLYKRLSQADILISATSSPHYILKKDSLYEAAAGRKRPLYIYDLAIPRDVEPLVKDIKMIFLQNLDDLEEVIEEIHEEKYKNWQPAKQACN